MFLQNTWKFRDAGKSKTETLPADNYEFPFDIVLQGSLPESLEGLHESWITYRFKAEIGRRYAKNIAVRKPFRIIRTLDPTALELSHMMVCFVAQLIVSYIYIYTCGTDVVVHRRLKTCGRTSWSI